MKGVIVNQLICGTSLLVDNLEGRSIACFDQEHVHLKSKETVLNVSSLSILSSAFLASASSSEACSSTVKSIIQPYCYFWGNNNTHWSIKLFSVEFLLQIFIAFIAFSRDMKAEISQSLNHQHTLEHNHNQNNSGNQAQQYND